uniref:JmjC domain-containing protein n=2 Tax=Lotharella globosa TaxID=91324 RepID=A0A7S4DSM5_9EUKA
MMDLIGLEDKMNVLFLSPDKDSALPFQAHDISFHANVAGEQTWVFYSPEGVPNLVSSHFILSDIDGNYLSGLSKNKRPKFCTTKPGSVVVIPKYWHHARVSQTPAVTLGLMVPHTGVKAPKNAKDKTTASQLDSEIEEYPFVHQLHVDRAILAVKSDPKQCLSSMKKAVEVSPNNVALRWQVARLFSKIGAKSEALEMTSKTIKMLADTTKQKMPGKDDDKGEDSDEDEDVNKPWSPKYAGLHWSKFGQLLLFDLKMPLEAIICFQMRLHLTPEDTNTVLLKSRALTMMGALDEAKITLQDAQKADPKNDQLKTMLEELNSDEAKNLVETMKAMKGTGAGFGNDKFSLEALEKIKTEDGRIAMPSFAAVSS